MSSVSEGKILIYMVETPKCFRCILLIFVSVTVEVKKYYAKPDPS